MVIDGETHQLSLNDFGTQFRHHVHGGNLSFDRFVLVKVFFFFCIHCLFLCKKYTAIKYYVKPGGTGRPV